MPMIANGAPSPHGRIFWEQADQTAVREGRWKLVLNGQLVEGSPPDDAVHLADLDADMGETTNRKDDHPDVAARLKVAAEHWREGTEHRWQEEFSTPETGTVTHTPGDGSS